MLMEIYKVKNSRGQEVGFIEEGIYYTSRDYNRGQIFRKYGNGLAVDKEIIRKLLQMNANELMIRVINFENTDFWAKINVVEFIDLSFKVNFDKRNEYGQNYTGYGEQLVCLMSKFEKIYNFQKRLDEFDKKTL